MWPSNYAEIVVFNFGLWIVSSFVLSEKWLIFTQILKWRIFILYGRAKSNASKATRLYHEAYISNRRQPSRRMFSKIQLLRETGQFKPNLVAVDRDLLELLHSSKIFYAQLKTYLVEECKKDPKDHHTVWNILHDQFLLPIMSSTFRLFYYWFATTGHFYQWLLRCNQDRQFLCNILFTDEASLLGWVRIYIITFITYVGGEMKILMLS